MLLIMPQQCQQCRSFKRSFTLSSDGFDVYMRTVSGTMPGYQSLRPEGWGSGGRVDESIKRVYVVRDASLSEESI